MLRVSSDASDLGIDMSTLLAAPPSQLPASAELAALARALTVHPAVDPVAERDAVIAVLGRDGAERAVSVCATFQLMNRLLDGVGAPVPRTLDGLALELGFELADVHH